MLFLADENIPQSSVERIRASGHDVLAGSDIGRGSPDALLLARSVDESRILLTFDRDFGALAFRSEKPCAYGIVLFRMTPETPGEPAELLLDLLDRPELALQGHFTVIDRDRVRQRPLPRD